MAILDLSPRKEQIVFSNDSLVVQNYVSGIPGGRTLVVTGYPLSAIYTGHLIIAKDGEYRPYPIKATSNGEGYEYDTLTTGFSVVGILISTISASKPAAAILTAGSVNKALLPYSPKAADLAVLKNIVFNEDENA